MEITENQPIDVFIDHENVGFLSRFETKWFLDNLVLELMSRKFRVHSIWGAVSNSKRGVMHRLTGNYKRRISAVFEQAGHTIRWTRENADMAIMQEINRRLRSAILCKNVLLISGDHHFSALVRKLRLKEYYVLVAGHEVSKQLANTATSAIKLVDLLPDMKRETEYLSSIADFNPVLFLYR